MCPQALPRLVTRAPLTRVLTPGTASAGACPDRGAIPRVGVRIGPRQRAANSLPVPAIAEDEST